MHLEKHYADEQNRLLALYPQAERLLRQYPGVLHVGLGIKEVGRQHTPDMAFRVYVQKKVPPEFLAEADRIPPEINGVLTDVLQKEEFDELVCQSTDLHVDDHKYRSEGLRGGIQIRNSTFNNEHPSGFGTLGCLGRTTDSTHKLVGLSCAHVVNAGIRDVTTTGTVVAHPLYYTSCCCCTSGDFGTVLRSVHTDKLDCAIIEITDVNTVGAIASNHTENLVRGADSGGNPTTVTITGCAQAVCFETVTKRGRSTGWTTGTVADVLYDNGQILIHRTDPGPFACYGDSGAVILNSALKVIGLLWGADQDTLQQGLANHIGPALDALGISIAGDWGAGIATYPTAHC